MKCFKRVISLFLSALIVFGPVMLIAGHADAETAATSAASMPTSNAQQLQQLVAPIALYPDSLVAQILAAATYPDQVVQADRWLQAHPELTGDQLAQAVDRQTWDPSVKALTEFPSVLANMDKNLSWTSSLGDAYVNNQSAVMDAVQAMRQSAEKAGNLKSSSQLKVSNQGQTIVIEPASTEVVYVPTYDPWLAYGFPVAPWPGWYWYPGLYWTSPGLYFGVGFPIGYFGGFGWGWHSWHPDWDHRAIVFNHATYVFHNRTFVHRDYYANRARTYVARDRALRAGSGYRGVDRIGRADAHAFSAPHTTGIHNGASGGVVRGGVSRGFGGGSGIRGATGGGFHGGGGSHGGGGFHGGGGGHR
jgi:hypothetical protein